MSKYRMLSLDTSSTISGWAYWENAKLIKSGVIAPKSKDKEERLDSMCLSLLDTLNTYKPQTVVIEMTVVERNAQTQRLLSEIVGVVRGWAILNNSEFVSFRPNDWRKLVCRDEKIPKKREECKTWSIEKVLQSYKIKADDNESDAILIGEARINQFL